MLQGAKGHFTTSTTVPKCGKYSERNGTPKHRSPPISLLFYFAQSIQLGHQREYRSKKERRRFVYDRFHC